MGRISMEKAAQISSVDLTVKRIETSLTDLTIDEVTEWRYGKIVDASNVKDFVKELGATIDRDLKGCDQCGKAFRTERTASCLETCDSCYKQATRQVLKGAI